MSNFEHIVNEMQRHGMKLPNERQSYQLPNAKEVLHNALTYFLTLENRQLQWLPEYDEVAHWLADNKGRGLFLYGNCGRGKSIICRYVLPGIYLKYFRKVMNVYDIQEMNAKLDEVLAKHIIVLDDIGTEEAINHFGNKRLAFAEIMDATEKQGKLLVVSSNLQQKDLLALYGDRVLERIKSTTERVLFSGASMRR